MSYIHHSVDKAENSLSYSMMLLREWDKMPESKRKDIIHRELRKEIKSLRRIIKKLQDGNPEIHR